MNDQPLNPTKFSDIINTWCRDISGGHYFTSTNTARWTYLGNVITCKCVNSIFFAIIDDTYDIIWILLGVSGKTKLKAEDPQLFEILHDYMISLHEKYLENRPDWCTDTSK